MRSACKALIATAFTAVACASAAPANAQEAVEVLREGTSEHCLIGTGACEMHMVSFPSLGGHIKLKAHTALGEILVMDCQHEATIDIDEEGTGYIYNGSLFGNPGCGANAHRPCSDGGVQEDWLVQLSESHESGVVRMHINFCIDGTVLGRLRGEVTGVTIEAANSFGTNVQEQDPTGPTVASMEFQGGWVYESPHKWTFVH